MAGILGGYPAGCLHIDMVVLSSMALPASEWLRLRKNSSSPPSYCQKWCSSYTPKAGRTQSLPLPIRFECRSLIPPWLDLSRLYWWSLPTGHSLKTQYFAVREEYSWNKLMVTQRYPHLPPHIGLFLAQFLLRSAPVSPGVRVQLISILKARTTKFLLSFLCYHNLTHPPRQGSCSASGDRGGFPLLRFPLFPFPRISSIKLLGG